MLHDLAQHIRLEHENILSSWMTAVRADPTVPSAHELDDVALLDHLNAVLIELAECLTKWDCEEQPNRLRWEGNAHAHGELRWEQCYRVDEVVREIAVLRSSFQEFFGDYLKQRRQISTDEFLHSTRIIHRYFDDISSESVACYVRKREAQAEKTAQALRLLNDTLEQANRSHESAEDNRRRTLRTVAHEMAASVNALGLGVTYMAESEVPQERREGQQLVSRTLVHIKEMLGQLLDFTTGENELERVRLQLFPVSPMFDYLVATFRPLAERKGLRFRAELDGELVDVRSDENKVQRIAMNLLSNATKYTTSGSIALTMRGVDSETWSIEVQDTGCGIPQGERERIFTEFQRLAQHSSEPGLGLGLSIVRVLVQRLGGHVELHSTEGQGSRFCVTLPRGV